MGRWELAAVAVLLGLSLGTAGAEEKDVIERVERTSPNHTTIIYKDLRPQARKPRPQPVPEFKEYDLGVPAPAPQVQYVYVPTAQAYVPPGQGPVYVPPSRGPVTTYSQTYSPGPNRGKAANGGSLAPGGQIFYTGFVPYYPYNPYFPPFPPCPPGPVKVFVPQSFQNMPIQRFPPPPPHDIPPPFIR